MADIVQREPIGPVTPTNASRPPAQRKRPGQGVRTDRDADRKRRPNRDQTDNDRNSVDEYV